MSSNDARESRSIPVGIDVGSLELVVSAQLAGEVHTRCFGNRADGRMRLKSWLRGLGGPSRVCLEATGVYSLDVTMMLHEANDVEVMVANPRGISNHAKAILTRGKSDPIDSVVLMDYAQRMPFKVWRPPSESALTLRAVARHLQALAKIKTAASNRRHASHFSDAAGQVVQEYTQAHVVFLQERIDGLCATALEMVQCPSIARKFELLLTVTGIAERSAVLILGELSTLPEHMSARQWVAYAGLDPIPNQSGKRVYGRRISKRGSTYLRGALYMPALVASRHCPRARGLYERLLANGKRRQQAIVAIMRKQLHWIHAMFRTDTPYSGRL